jgi:predicted amidohydrolase
MNDHEMITGAAGSHQQEEIQSELNNIQSSTIARGDHWAKIVEQRAIKNRVQYIHCR